MKRLFQVLDEMNVNDEKNKTATCACCFDLVEAKTAKGGAHVIMGVPAEALHKIMLNEYKPMLVLLDMKEYKRLEAWQVVDKLQEAEQRAERYEKALKDIMNPVAYLQRKAEQEGGVLSGMAFQVANDPAFIKSIATEALTPKSGSDE